MKDRIGEEFISKEGCLMRIIRHRGTKYYDIEFVGFSYIRENIQIYQIESGCVKNPYYPSVFGVGYIGVGDYKVSKDKKVGTNYKRWQAVIERGYCPLYKEKHQSYKDVTVCEEWHNFQNFAKWFEENYNCFNTGRWDLDKDILIKGNKVYSPDTCCFVPQEINKQLIGVNSERPIPTGVYKNSLKWVATLGTGKRSKELGRYKTMEEASEVYIKAKEDRLKNLANKWKDFLRPDVYDRLLEIKF